MIYVSVFCALLNYSSLLALASKEPVKTKGIGLISLSSNPPPPQLQDNRNPWSFSISCDLQCLYSHFAMIATAKISLVQLG